MPGQLYRNHGSIVSLNSGLAASDERVRSKKTAVNVLPWGWDQGLPQPQPCLWLLSSFLQAHAPLGEKNPVSQLLEVCQSQGWTTPAFDFHEEGPPNARRWICTVSDSRLVGMGAWRHVAPDN